MTTFPLLKTSAVMQYPATKTVEFRNQRLRFVDGVEQGYRDAASLLNSWVIQLNALDDGELAAIESFFQANQGQCGSFSFTDPWTNTVYSNCSLRSGDLELEWSGELRGRTAVTIVQNRN